MSWKIIWVEIIWAEIIWNAIIWVEIIWNITEPYKALYKEFYKTTEHKIFISIKNYNF